MANDIQNYSRILVNGYSRRLAISPEDYWEAVQNEAAKYIADGRISRLIEWERAVFKQGDISNIVAMLSRGSKMAHDSSSVWAELGVNVGDDDGLRDLVMTRYYGGIYFSYEQAAWLDAAIAIARRMPRGQADVGLTLAMQFASSLVTSVGGHYAQPVQVLSKAGVPKDRVALKIAQQRAGFNPIGLLLMARKHVSGVSTDLPILGETADFREAIIRHGEDSLIYADPPYTREHYSRFYHVLETIAVGDEPGLSYSNLGGGSMPSKGLYRVQRHQSEFSIVSQAQAAFDDMFEMASRRNAKMLLSYSPTAGGETARPRSVVLPAVLGLAEKHYRKVDLLVIDGARHARLNRRDVSQVAPDGAEVLVFCAP
ncbi:hypothetical protein GCM10009627_26870 [Curtobacterium herbarum]|uniref:DNA methyltransferase n=1 Tax=Curtobacterium herbarum TaxID=150122 RepID=A0ABN1ZF35_9MICO